MLVRINIEEACFKNSDTHVIVCITCSKILKLLHFTHNDVVRKQIAIVETLLCKDYLLG